MIGTGMAIALGLSALAGQTASNIYGTRSANKTNQKSIAASEASDQRAAAAEAERLHVEQEAQARRDAIERERLAEDKRVTDAKMANDNARWQDYLRINEPYWRAGAGVASNLFDIAGYGAGNAPSFSMPTGGPPQGAPAGGAPPVLGGPRPPGTSGPAGGPGSGSQMTGGGPPLPDGIYTANAPRGARAPAPIAAAPPQPQSLDLSKLMMLAKSLGKGSQPPPPQSLNALMGMGV